VIPLQILLSCARLLKRVSGSGTRHSTSGSLKIDRRVLHGLGELATPRWTRSVANREEDVHALDQDDLEPPLPEEPEDMIRIVLGL